MVKLVFRSFFKGLVDNIGFLILWNGVVLALFLGAKLLINLFESTPAVLGISLGLVWVLSFALSAGSRAAAVISRGEKGQVGQLFNSLPGVIFDSLVLLLMFLLLFVTFNSLGFYWTDPNALSKVSFILLLAGTAVGALILQFYLALRIQENAGFRVALKLAITFVTDNPFYAAAIGAVTLGLLILTFICTVVSLSPLSSTPLLMMLPTCIPLALFPGFMGILIFSQTAFAFRCRKYGWLEAHPDFDPKKERLPWQEILADEAKRLQPKPRSLNRSL